MGEETLDNIYQAAREVGQAGRLTTANEEQIGGDHYKKLPIQPWDYIAANDLDFFQGQVVKYVTRWKSRGRLDDLKKARHVLDKYIELEQAKPQPPLAF